MGIRAVIDRGGRILVPRELRSLADIRPGDQIELDWVDGEIRVRTMTQVLGLARNILVRRDLEESLEAAE